MKMFTYVAKSFRIHTVNIVIYCKDEQMKMQ